MRDKTKSLLFFILFILLCGNIQQNAQEEDKRIKEHVDVVNIELIIRALHKGQPVSGLKKSDFTLYENGKKLEITSFVEIRRKIGINTEKEVKKEEDLKKQRKKRLFLFYFWIHEPESPYQDALEYFFDRIYKDGDYVLLIVKNLVFKISRKGQIKSVLSQFKKRVDEVAKKARLEIYTTRYRLEELFKNFTRLFMENQKNNTPQDILLNDFKIKYKNIWEEYKARHISSNIEKLRRIAHSLRTLNLEKWGIVFYQQNTFLQYNPEKLWVTRNEAFGDIEKLKKILHSLYLEIKRPKASVAFIDKIQQAFISANSTFFLFLLDSKLMYRMESGYSKIDYVYSEWEVAFRNISKATGGNVINNKNLKKSLVSVIEKEDIFYRLTYAPQILDKGIRKIKVKANNKSLKVLYNERVVLNKSNEITIDNFSLSYPKLEFSLNNFNLLFDGNRICGDIEIKVTAIDNEGKTFSFNKILEPDKNKVSITINLNFPHTGKYTLIIEAIDKQTLKSIVSAKNINITKISEMSDPLRKVLITETHKRTTGIDKKNKLNTILKNSANYCKKLKKTAFHFICKEKITDSFYFRGKKIKENTYLYDYQIIMKKNGKMHEKRSLIKNKAPKKSNKKKSDTELIITNFFSDYPFLLPVTLLARENQKNYHYQLLSKEKINNRETFKLSVKPKQNCKNINYGVVWVDKYNGSVIKIELDPRSLKGIDKLKDNARRKGTKLKVTDVHWYEIERNGIRFPSRTEIGEIYLVSKGKNSQKFDILEKSKTAFMYRKYLFFNVNMKTQFD